MHTYIRMATHSQYRHCVCSVLYVYMLYTCLLIGSACWVLLLVESVFVPDDGRQRWMCWHAPSARPKHPHEITWSDSLSKCTCELLPMLQWLVHSVLHALCMQEEKASYEGRPAVAMAPCLQAVQGGILRQRAQDGHEELCSVRGGTSCLLCVVLGGSIVVVYFSYVL